ncbi:hypothetical protein Q0A17_04330 [Citrobacter sp. S2-9]|uniref:DUF2971 domain-containing protein n=1 Tax=Citrobacter enshiensis TaxID=2971264 RepID=A0ABT8PQN7_9ENTR|nr:hypothetical protein [Citrobacter enshiensis]MDN8598649.1 hypothetical protein [Citrobacter enshiensis]
MSAVSFSTFAELMDHEFTNTTQKIEKIGYKVDGKGIKSHCSCTTLKSVDYFHEIEGDMIFIEFSDLESQKSQQAILIDELKKSGMGKGTIRLFVKELHKSISVEMRKKYIDSIHILRCMNGKIVDVPEWASNRDKGKYVIVVAPLPELSPKEKRIELLRLLDKLESDLTLSIPEPLFSGVKVMPLDKFIN